MRKKFVFIIVSLFASLIPVFTHSAFASAPIITTTSLVHEITGMYRSEAIDISAGVAPFTWSIASGSLPDGISLGSSDGMLSGAPNTPGTYPFTVQVIDANSDSDTQDLMIAVRQPLSITTSTLPDGTVGQPYSHLVTITGGAGPFDWELISGSLPDGLSLNTATGEISGTPVQDGLRVVGVGVTDADGQVTSQYGLMLGINPTPLITTVTLPDGAINTAYNGAGLANVGGTLPLSWSIVSGALPDGIFLEGSSGGTTGNLHGRPESIGTFTFVVRAQDANGASSEQELTVTVNYAPPVIANTATDATVNRAYLKTIGLNGGMAPFTWSILSGSLPSGFSIASSSGQISGSPTTPSSSSFVVQVTDANLTTTTRSMTLAVRSAPEITTTSLPDGATNTPYLKSIGSTGGARPFTWSVTSGSLPNGISINTTSGVLSGRPTTAASTSFTVRLTDTNGAVATQSFTLAVLYASPTIATTTLPSTIAKGYLFYSEMLDVYGGTAPYTWSVVSGSIPNGLQFDNNGHIFGTTNPSDAGTYTITFQVEDANAETDTQEITLVVYSTPTITTDSLPNGTEGVAYDQALAVNGGLAPYTWGIPWGSAPNGLSIDSATGEISGTPNFAGSFWFTVQVQDANGSTATKEFTVLIE